MKYPNVEKSLQKRYYIYWTDGPHQQQPYSHVDDAAGDVHKIFLSIEKRARNKCENQEKYDNDRCEQLLDLNALQILIESRGKVADQESV